jgi:hypothetical protein
MAKCRDMARFKAVRKADMGKLGWFPEARKPRWVPHQDSDWGKDIRLYGWPDADPYYMMMES